jgi:O-antigen/teichoic acid export membrane protein
MQSFMPYSMKIINEEKQQASNELNKHLCLYTRFALIGVIVMQFCASHELLSLLFSSEYATSADVIGLLALSNVFYGFTYFSCLGSWKAHKSHHYSISICAGVALNAFLNVLIVPLYGIYGAALATFASMCMTLILNFMFSHKSYPFSYNYQALFNSTSVVTFWIIVETILSYLNIQVPLILKLVISSAIVLFLLNQTRYHSFPVVNND